MCNEEKDSLTIKPLDKYFGYNIVFYLRCGKRYNSFVLVCFIVMIWWGFLKTETMVPEEDGAFRGL